MTPPIDHAALRARFNPDGSTFRRMQLRELEILSAVHDICRRHGLNYWLGSGTLLGAVRHGGFIPWDDDVDIEMPRADYLRLLEILPRELPADMQMQNHQTDPGFYYTYTKVRCRRSVIKEQVAYDSLFAMQGIYIDIFPMEQTPRWLLAIANKSFSHIYTYFRRGWSRERLTQRLDRWYRLHTRLLFPLARLVARPFRGDTLTYSFGIPFLSRRRLSQILPLSTIDFEGSRFLAPRSPHDYLRSLYGNYEELPDLDKLPQHTERVEFGEEPA